MDVLNLHAQKRVLFIFGLGYRPDNTWLMLPSFKGNVRSLGFYLFVYLFFLLVSEFEMY